MPGWRRDRGDVLGRPRPHPGVWRRAGKGARGGARKPRLLRPVSGVAWLRPAPSRCDQYDILTAEKFAAVRKGPIARPAIRPGSERDEGRPPPPASDGTPARRRGSATQRVARIRVGDHGPSTPARETIRASLPGGRQGHADLGYRFRTTRRLAVPMTHWSRNRLPFLRSAAPDRIGSPPRHPAPSPANPASWQFTYNYAHGASVQASGGPEALGASRRGRRAGSRGRSRRVRATRRPAFPSVVRARPDG